MLNSKFIFLLILLPVFSARSQDSLQLDVESKPILSAFAIGVDYGKLAGQFLDSESKFELGGQLEFKNRIIFVSEFGLATLTSNGAYQNTNYTSDGNYFRFGLGYKIDMSAKNNIYFSLRYARASFSDRGVIDITSSSGIYNDLEEPFSRDGLSAQWYEVVVSSETRLWKGLYAGFHVRLRIMDKYDEQQPLDVYTIPGYGRSFDRTIPALNLYIKYAIERF
ncbi:MAG: DUF6048 family protein [Reichenbachiella sp.]|uniref:DUF6048 family protein n=1 Tax=Reichenbachiella sp. TaxID=2184521 RepID=UPI00326604E4